MKPRTFRERKLVIEGLRMLEESLLLEGKPNNTIAGGLGEIFTLWYAVNGLNKSPSSASALKKWCTGFGAEGVAAWNKSTKQGQDLSFIQDFLNGGSDTEVQQEDARINAEGIRLHYKNNIPKKHGFKGGTTGKASNQGDIFFGSDMWSVKVGGSQGGQASPGFAPIAAHTSSARVSTSDLCIAVVSAFTGLSISDIKADYDFIQVADKNVKFGSANYKAERRRNKKYLLLPYSAGMSSYVNPVLQTFLVNLIGFNSRATLQVIDDLLAVLKITGPKAVNPWMADPKSLSKYIDGTINAPLRTSNYYQDLIDFETAGKPIDEVQVYTQAGNSTAYLVWVQGSTTKVLCKTKLRRGDNKGPIANLKFDCVPNGYDVASLTPSPLPSGYTPVQNQTLNMSVEIEGNTFTISL